MRDFRIDIEKLTRQLYPTGRAFKWFPNSWFKAMHRALAISENVAYNQAIGVLDKVLPDNENFTGEDAGAWELRLGLIFSPTVPLEDRKKAIQRKMNHPGNIKARQHYLYVQSQLRAAGFDVYVYENRFFEGGEWITKSVFDVSNTSNDASGFQHGDEQHGDEQHGGSFANIIANYIEEDLDSTFSIPNNLRCTFFIGADPLGDWANVPLNRKNEFRQLILKLKPAQMVGYLLVNYV